MHRRTLKPVTSGRGSWVSTGPDRALLAASVAFAAAAGLGSAVARAAVGVPLRVVRLTVPLPDITQRLAADVTSGRQDDLREAAAQLAASAGVGLEDLLVANDRPIGVAAAEIMSWLGWA